jgi:hypothetical protein
MKNIVILWKYNLYEEWRKILIIGISISICNYKRDEIIDIIRRDYTFYKNALKKIINDEYLIAYKEMFISNESFFSNFTKLFNNPKLNTSQALIKKYQDIFNRIYNDKSAYITITDIISYFKLSKHDKNTIKNEDKSNIENVLKCENVSAKKYDDYDKPLTKLSKKSPSSVSSIAEFIMINQPTSMINTPSPIVDPNTAPVPSIVNTPSPIVDPNTVLVPSIVNTPSPIVDPNTASVPSIVNTPPDDPNTAPVPSLVNTPTDLTASTTAVPPPRPQIKLNGTTKNLKKVDVNTTEKKSDTQIALETAINNKRKFIKNNSESEDESDIDPDVGEDEWNLGGNPNTTYNILELKIQLIVSMDFTPKDVKIINKFLPFTNNEILNLPDIDLSRFENVNEPVNGYLNKILKLQKTDMLLEYIKLLRKYKKEYKPKTKTHKRKIK